MTLLLALLSGICLGLSFPPNGWGPLEWVALVPLFVAARQSRSLVAAGLGAVATLTASAIILCPLRSPEAWGNAIGAAGIFSMVLFWTCAYAASLRTTSPFRWALGVACAGVFGEWISHCVFPAYLALGQWRDAAILPVARVTGIWGVSFLLYLTNAVIAASLETARKTGSLRLRGGPWAMFRSAAWIAVGITGLHFWGLAVDARPVPGTALRVAALQPGEGDPLPLLREARLRGARLAVWPEAALSEPLGRDLLRDRAPGLYQVIGYSGETPAEGLPDNLASLVTPGGTILGKFSKIHLFGTEQSTHRAGSRVAPIPSPWGPMGLAICFDTMFTEVVRDMAHGGARIVAVPNEDPPVGRDSLAALHAAATAFRAAENGVPIVRSEWSARSMIFDAQGRVVAEAGAGSPCVLVGDIVLPDRPGTLYTRTGDLFPWLCALGMVALAAWEMARKPEHRA